jgi:N4-gp56 family major capsid protein
MALKLTSVNILTPWANPMFTTYINKAFLEVFEPNLEFAKHAEPSINQKGYSSITWMKPDRMNVTASQALLTPGETPTSTATTVGTLTATAKQYGIYSIMTDELIQQVGSGYNLVSMISQRISENMARIVDRVIQDEVLDNASTRIYAATTSGGARASNRAALTANNKLFQYDLAFATKVLKEKYVPMIGGLYVAILHTNVVFDLANETGVGGFIDNNKYKRPEMIDNADVTVLRGVRVRESAYVKTYTNAGGVTVYPSIVFGKQAFGWATLDSMQVIFHDFNSGGTSDALNQRSTAGAKVSFASKILQQDSIIVLESAAS